MKWKKTIKWLLLPFLCAIIILSFILSSVSVKAENTLTPLKVGVPVDRCPVFYEDSDTKEIVGIGVDLMKIAAKNSGYDVSFVRIEEATLKEALDNEKYDVLMPFGSPIKSNLGKSSIVSENLFQTPFTLVTKDKGNVPPLNDIHVGMLKSLSGAGDTVHQMYPDMKISFYNDMNESVNALRSGEVNALLHNSYVWSYVLQKPSYSDLKVHPDAMFSMDFRAATLDTPKGQEIIEQLNFGIGKITDTQRQAITLDYTSRSLYRYDFGDYIYKYGFVMLLIVLLIIAVIIIAIMKAHSIRKKHEEKLRMLVDHDLLTDTYSLEGFRKRVEEILHNHKDNSYLLIYSNIKNFKYINESLGKSSGDELLRFFANSVKQYLTDVEAIGRVNADRFVILYRNEGEEKMRDDNQKTFDPVRNFYIDRGKDNRVSLCYGIYVLTPEDYTEIDVDRLIANAHLAEKKVRNTSNDGYEFYNPEQWAKGKRTAELINYLPIAIENGGIQVWYQPQVDYNTGKIIGAEALCRWNHDKLGFLLPADFISILEESGLIYNLDSYVWDKVCQDLKRWNEQGYHRVVSVNVSRCDIREDRNIPEQFNNLIKKYNLTPDQLRIEITESAYVENSEIIISNTTKLRELGFQVEMDDFGSGYSSLNMLKEIPVDRIKLDLRFLTANGDLKKCHTIISCIIQMLNLLEIKSISEGVETVEQAEFLKEHGCSDMQGFYFYKALPVEEFEKLKDKF